MKSPTLLFAVLFCVIGMLAADAVAVSFGWIGTTTGFELVGSDNCFVREHRKGVIVRVTYDLPEHYHHSALGYEAIERLNEQSGLR